MVSREAPCCRLNRFIDRLPRFLLKYISRDEIELLSSGGGGVVEIRNAIEQYSEKSPLYGFIQYRRRKVLLKYIPEGTSRLLQGTIGTANKNRTKY